jgi:hypothetical protein
MNSIRNVCGKDIRIRGRLIRVAGLDADMYEFLEDPEPTLQSIRRLGVRVDLFTFMQRLPETSPKYRYPMEWDNLAVLPVSTFDHWWTDQIGFKARNKAKQAERKGVRLCEVPFDDALVRGIWEVYNESPVRQGRPFVHYGKDLETVRREAGTFLDRSFFIGAFLENKMIGFVKLICDETRTQAGLVHILSLIGQRDKAPTNALIAAAVRSCAARQLPYLVYSRFDDGKKHRDPLIDFKVRNGFKKVDLPRYYVPLTRLGLMAMNFGLHRNLTSFVPEPILSRVRKLRNSWYNRQLDSVKEEA